MLIKIITIISPFNQRELFQDASVGNEAQSSRNDSATKDHRGITIPAREDQRDVRAEEEHEKSAQSDEESSHRHDNDGSGNDDVWEDLPHEQLHQHGSFDAAIRAELFFQ